MDSWKNRLPSNSIVEAPPDIERTGRLCRPGPPAGRTHPLVSGCSVGTFAAVAGRIVGDGAVADAIVGLAVNAV